MNGMGLRLGKDDSGVSSTLEFMLSFVVAAAIFTFFVINLNSLISLPKDDVRTNQYIDVGNDVSTKIIDTYLVAPDNGDLRINFNIPRTIVGDSYSISVQKNLYDREVRVTSGDGQKSVYMVLNGANSTIRIGGKTNSTDQIHNIKFINQEEEGP